jgi:nitrogen fixation protein
MSDIIDINVGETIEEVTINVVDNLITVNINKVTGGGGSQTLAETLVLGNITDGENISISNGDAIILDNGSMLKKGTIDAGNGGAKGISQICGVGYEHKWEAGRLYIMNDGGTIIREVSHNLTYTPTATDDVTKGFVQNTRWILDNGDVYVCSDPTEGAAVWEFITGAVPTLQQVLDNNHDLVDNNNFQGTDAGVGNTGTEVNALGQFAASSNTGNAINALGNGAGVDNTGNSVNALGQETAFENIGNDVNALGFRAGVNNTFNNVNLFGETAQADENGQTVLSKDGTIMARISTTDLTASRKYNLPNASGTLALTSDIPSSSTFVPYTGATTNVDLGEYELKAGQLTLDTTPTGTAAVATTRWNDSLGSSETTLKGGSVILKNGVDLVARVVNKVTPNTTLTKAAYQVVRISGAQGQRLSVNLAQANNDNNSADTLGIVTETIATNQEGFIITVGQLEGINTTGSLQSETWADGDVLYLSPTTAGKITNIKPTGATGHIVVLGYVEYAHSVNGKIYVKIMNGWELDELHNVFIDTPTNNQALTYETSTDLWKNKTIIEDSITNGVTDKAPSQNAVFDALALKQDKFYTYKNPVLSTGVTGTLSETEVLKVTIPANTFSANDFLKFQATISKTGTAGACTMRIKLTSSSTMPSGTTNTIATYGLGATNLFLNFSRTSHRIRSGNIFGYLFTNNNNAHDFIASGSAQNSQAFDVTVENYIYVSLINGSIADTTYLEGITITNQ